MSDNTLSRSYWPIPACWEWTSIGNISTYVRGVSYKKQDARKAADSNLIAIVRANNINDGLALDDLVFVPRRYVSEDQLIRAHDIVVAMSSGSKSVVGKAAQATHSYDAAHGAFCGLVRPDPTLDGRFLGYFFQTKFYRDRISEDSKGSNINNLKLGHIAEMPMPVPPLM